MHTKEMILWSLRVVSMAVKRRGGFGKTNMIYWRRRRATERFKYAVWVCQGARCTDENLQTLRLCAVQSENLLPVFCRTRSTAGQLPLHRAQLVVGGYSLRMWLCTTSLRLQPDFKLSMSCIEQSQCMRHRIIPGINGWKPSRYVQGYKSPGS